jgi:hypothetical protein
LTNALKTKVKQKRGGKNTPFCVFFQEIIMSNVIPPTTAKEIYQRLQAGVEMIEAAIEAGETKKIKRLKSHFKNL